MPIEILAFIAAAIGVCGSLPQIVRILRTRDTYALSAINYMMLVVASVMWIAYGVQSHVYSIIFWNSVATLLNLAVLLLKMSNEGVSLRAFFKKHLARFSSFRFLEAHPRPVFLAALFVLVSEAMLAGFVL